MQKIPTRLRLKRSAARRLIGPGLAAVLSLAGAEGLAESLASGGLICREQTQRLERAAGIPDQLLGAISIAETGRWDKGRQASFAWPWTVTSGKDGRHFASKRDAIAWVKTLKARGVTNIDVGCMQINLGYHPDAFESLEEAFDPSANVAYAASFLKRLFRRNNSWTMAVAHYHSTTPARHRPYWDKVVRLWNAERHRAAVDRREAVKAAYLKKMQDRGSTSATAKRTGNDL